MSIHVTDKLLYQYVPKADAELLAEIPDRPQLSFVPSQDFQKKMKRLIWQSRHPGRHYRYMKTGGRVVMIIVVVLVVSAALTVGVKATRQLRVRMLEKIQHTGYVEEHYSVSGEENGGIKRLTYVPKGYELADREQDDYFCTEEYANDKNEKIVFSAFIIEDGGTVQRDTEFIESHESEIRGQQVLFGTKDNGWISCSWYEENILYMIGAENVTENTLMQMIEKMKQ